MVFGTDESVLFREVSLIQGVLIDRYHYILVYCNMCLKHSWYGNVQDTVHVLIIVIINVTFLISTSVHVHINVLLTLLQVYTYSIVT